MSILRKYGAGTTVLFPLIDAGAQDFESSPVSFAAGDTQISKDEAAFGNTSNSPSHEGNGIYSLTLTAAEMQAARIAITVIDQTATKAWEDQAIIIETYGNASGQHEFDLDTATQSVSVSSIGSSAVDSIHDEAVEGSLTLRQAVKIMLAALAGKSTGGGTSSHAYRDQADSKDRISATVDANGNRTAVTVDGA